MLIYSINFFIFMYFSGLIVFCLKCNHLLLMLLSLEFIVLTLYVGLMLFILTFMYESYFLMIFLTMSVCEGALGLSLLVLMVRSFGNDYFKSLSVLW
uniref:NADH-ubiquinone oxidoreductase chain 4L n=1 Tax=Asymmetricata circumdata TaxID=1915122 RepID=A0A343A7J8_9COLE|nr:NADH dehydrogenase subunit 4L [Asymmetricata circumdata]APB92614.1 NADH dehydrogenase subunit 4L [Asymmetricata circumdata]